MAERLLCAAEKNTLLLIARLAILQALHAGSPKWRQSRGRGRPESTGPFADHRWRDADVRPDGGELVRTPEKRK